MVMFYIAKLVKIFDIIIYVLLISLYLDTIPSNTYLTNNAANSVSLLV